MNGLLGGTFNPIHLGHLSIALDVLQTLSLSSVHFLPSHTPVHRKSPQTSIQQRVDMVRLAISTEPLFHLNLTEIERGGSSYMIDTLKKLTQQNDEPWVLILGTDAFNHLHQWKSANDIFSYCHVVVCQRPEEKCTQQSFNQYRVDDKKELLKKRSGALFFLSVKPMPCSSTFIRENSSNTQAIQAFLPQSVLEFMQLNNLYESSKANVRL